MRIGFIGLGNLGANLAGSLLRNGVPLSVLDLDRSRMEAFAARGAAPASSPAALAEAADAIITCLPSPAASAAVMEGPDGMLPLLGSGKLWLEMSTTDAAEIRRLGERVAAIGAQTVECPVSGGCHRAATGNIAILVGGPREAFDFAFPALAAMGRQILHTGELGSASVLKVITNYLASTHLVALGEALTTAKQSGLDLATAFEAIRISSGNSFVHETESQVILNGSYDISFTMDLVIKDLSLFEAVAGRAGVPLEVSPRVLEIFRDGQERYGPRAWSSMIVKRLEDACGTDLRASGFPAQLVDEEPSELGREIRPERR